MTAGRHSLIMTIVLLCTSLPLPLVAAELDDIQRLTDNGKHAEALEQVQRYLHKHAGDKRALFMQALSLQHLGRTKEAMHDYEALTRRYPDSPEAWNNLAVLYAAQGQHNKARDALLSAINTHPSYATAYENLGNIYAKMAVSAYNRALETGKEEQAGPINLTNIDTLPRETSSRLAAVVPAAVVAARVSQAPTATDKDAEIRNIVDTVNGWVNAWSAQNVDGYLAYYAAAFKPANGLSRSRWENQRRERVQSPRFIKVTIKNPDVYLVDPVSARFSFEQAYQSDRYNDVSRKTLMLKKIDGQWQILREYAES